MKKTTALLMAIIMLIAIMPGLGIVHERAAAEGDSGLIFRVENQQIYNNNYTNLNDKVDELKSLEEGTIIVRFRYSGSTIMSLFSLSNNTLPNGHFHLYITPSVVGSENRYEEPGQTQVNTHLKANVAVKENAVHTVAMVADKHNGYKFFLDGKLIMHDTTSPRTFLNNIYQPNSAQLGHTERRAGSNMYPFNGEIDFAEVYSKPLADQEVMAITGVTSADPILNPMPEGAKITEPYSVFYPDLYGSKAYRIPSLIYTREGTLMAGIDKRINHGGDSPANIDIIVRRSYDQGDTWEDQAVLINDYPGNASNIDQALLQDQDTGRVFSLVLGFPEGGGYPTAVKGSGFKTVDGNRYMILKDASNNEYTIRANGEVFNSSNVKTAYRVDEKRNLYNNDAKVGNIFLGNSSLKPVMTSYLELWYSDDEGETWAGPRDLNPGLKEEWMAFLGAGPGNGIQLTTGENAGRLVFPVYFTNENGSQNSAVIYSDDHGVTWHRGESPNEGRIVNGSTMNERTSTGNELTENQVLEMPDGQLKMFSRNYSGYAQISTSFDGGATWDSEVVTERGLVAAYCQMTAIRYNGKIDGKDAVIFASPANSSSRINGTVKVGLISEDGTYPNGRTKYKFDWKYSQLVKEGYYAYSSLTNLPGGEIGLFYEGTGSETMSFIKFNPVYLKWQRYSDHPDTKLTSIALDAAQNGYEAGDKLKVKVKFDTYVMISGNRSLKGLIGDREVVFGLASQNAAGTEFMFEAAFPELAPGAYPLTAGFGTDVKIYNAYGVAFPAQADGNKLNTQVISGTETELPIESRLTGPDSVGSGEAFDILLGLSSMRQNVYAHDIKINYDADVMEYVSASSLIEGVQVIESKMLAPGRIRLILASAGADHAVTGDAQLLKLSFKAKEASGSTTGVIEVSQAELGLADGSEIPAAPSMTAVEVRPAGMIGDVNGDGKISIGDLAMVAAHYGKTSDSPDWEQIKHLDFTNNGSIDIFDLAFIAQRIIE